MQNYTMYAERIMNLNLPFVRPEDSAAQVLGLMDEYKVRHLPLVNGEEFQGLVYEEDLMEIDSETPMATLHARPVSVAPQCHLYDLVAQWVNAEVDAMPVIDEGKYVGTVDAPSILRFLAEQTHWAEKGAVIVLEVAERDLAISEIARLVEGNGTKIIACTTSQASDSSNVVVTLKLHSEDVQPVIATFQRHAYTIQTFLHAPKAEEEMRERYDAFMRFLKQ
jgi:predicted transcriptional regulator